MKKLSILFFICFLSACGGRDTTDAAKELNYYSSADETACAFVFYGVEGAPPLTIQDHVVDYRFGRQNIFPTSSPSNFGWASEEFSGARHVNFYNSEGVQITNEEERPLLFNGSIAVDDIERDYDVLHFNDREECFTNDSFKDFSIFSELVREIYKENKRE